MQQLVLIIILKKKLSYSGTEGAWSYVSLYNQGPKGV